MSDSKYVYSHILLLFTFLPFYFFTFSLLQQVVSEFLCSSCPVADVILDIHTQLSESLVVAFRLEDGIVAEALSSPTLLPCDCYYSLIRSTISSYWH